jgi:protein-disulfide isomerase
MEEAEKEKVFKIRIPRINLWMLSTIVLVILAGFLFIRSYSITGNVVETGIVSPTLTPEQAANKAIEYLNKNLVRPGTTASFVSVKEMSGVYEVTTSYQNQSIPIYVTKDGNYLFLQSLDMSKELPRPGTQQPQQAFDAPDKEKPEVNLFVMSFCPFGIQAENMMKSVVDLLGTKADIRVRFIANVEGDTVESIRSLHGINEAMEDLRQLCIMKYYDQETYWNYLMQINENCKSVYRDATALDKCWKDAATKFGIDTVKIDSCSKSSEALNLLKEDEKLTQQYGVSGSPTLIINGARYSGERSSEAFKQAI